MTYPRFLRDTLLERMKFFPVLLVIGPRQAGKTTLIKKFGKELELTYSSFDDLNNLVGVQLDPIGFLDHLKKPLILDEVQRAPEIFLPLKADVDENRIPGRYILTGSANPLLVPKVGDALTGRMAICNMWPLSQGEIIGVKETFLDILFSSDALPSELPRFDQKELLTKLFLGGFPALHTSSDKGYHKAWCNDYLSLSLQKDINDLAKIEGLAHLPVLLYGLAARIGSTLNNEDLSRLAKVASSSLKRYLQLLESLFLLYRLPAWSPNIDQRLVKAPKIYFTDTALLLHVLNMDQEQLGSNPHLLGHMLENFVIMECVKQATWAQSEPKLSHYRQDGDKGTEVDIVLESAGKVVGIEIKLSSLVRPDDIKGLNSLKELAGKSFHKGIVLYMGNRVLPLGDKLQAVPINALWQAHLKD